VCISPVSVFHTPHRTHLRFGQPNDIWWGRRAMKLLFTRLCRWLLAPFLSTPQLYFPSVWEMRLHTSIQQQQQPNIKFLYLTFNIPLVCVCASRFNVKLCMYPTHCIRVRLWFSQWTSISCTYNIHKWVFLMVVHSFVCVRYETSLSV
jgi:hypothetical protein